MCILLMYDVETGLAICKTILISHRQSNTMFKLVQVQSVLIKMEQMYNS